MSEADLENLRLKLRCKVRYHLGAYCPDVEDVVQESMTRLVRAHLNRRIERPENLGAFLNGICNNVISEYRRRVSRDAIPSPELPERAAPGISHGETLELRDSVDAAMSHLLSRDRRVLMGIYLEGKTPQEVCEENGIPEAHLKVVLSRAKSRFRTIYLERLKPAAPRRHYTGEA